MTKLIIPILLMCICGVTSAFGAPDLPKQPDAAPVELPKDLDVPVLTFNYRGGRLRRKTDEPILRVYPDGKVHIANPWGRSREMKIQVKPAELQSLLGDIVTKRRFFDLDGETIQTAVRESQRANGSFTRILDNSTVSIEVRAQGKVHSVSYYALDFYAKRHPEVVDLQQLNGVRKRIAHFLSIARAGGTEGASKFLAQANAEMKISAPEEKPFSLDELRYCNVSADGKTRMQFYRAKPDEDGKVTSYVMVNIELPEGGQAKITFDGK